MKRRVRFIFEIEREYADGWDDGLIEFHENSDCGQNALDAIQKFIDVYEVEHGCMCSCAGFFKAEVVTDGK